VLEVIRNGGNYNGANWTVTAGSIDQGFINYINKNNPNVLKYFSHSGGGASIINSSSNDKIDFLHLAATLNAQIYSTPVLSDSSIDDLAGWAGDLQQAVGEYQEYLAKYKISDNINDMTKAAEKVIASTSGKFSKTDMYADIDASNIGFMLNNNPKLKLSQALNNYYSIDVNKRYTNFVNNYGGSAGLQNRVDANTINAWGYMGRKIMNENEIYVPPLSQLKALGNGFMNYIAGQVRLGK
jgi:hypothetical protein